MRVRVRVTNRGRVRGAAVVPVSVVLTERMCSPWVRVRVRVRV